MSTSADRQFLILGRIKNVDLYVVNKSDRHPRKFYCKLSQEVSQSIIKLLNDKGYTEEATDFEEQLLNWNSIASTILFEHYNGHAVKVQEKWQYQTSDFEICFYALPNGKKGISFKACGTLRDVGTKRMKERLKIENVIGL
jgi:hypothetical protein